MQLLHVLRHDLDDDDDGNAEQHSPDAPQPPPEQQRNEYGRRIHVGDPSGHPGGHERSDDGSDRQRCAGDQQRHCKRFELHEGSHSRRDGRDAGPR